MNVTDFGDLSAGQPPITPEQYAAECDLARTYLRRVAPDLVEMVLGETA